MSSLLQFSGDIGKRGVRLEFVIEDKDHPWPDPLHYPDQFDCPECGEKHPFILTAWRKLAGMFGHWVVFRYLGEEHVPDLSIPIGVPRPPRGSVKLSAEESTKIWHT